MPDFTQKGCRFMFKVCNDFKREAKNGGHAHGVVK